MLEKILILRNQQLEFRQQSSSIRQVRRIAEVIRRTLGSKEYHSAAFLDIAQKCDEVWRPGFLVRNIKNPSPHSTEH
jgi:hypothetical protein